MARRAGKAAARKSRQRRVQQRAVSRPAAPPVPPMGAPVAAQASPAVSEAASSDTPRRTAAAAPSAGHGSTLSLRERAEYHYVERDLRNIGILTAVMAALLFLAWIAFTATGLVG